MPQKRLSQYIHDLSSEQKLLLSGSLLNAISVFLPWYQDVDRFQTGFRFLGITGPLYLVGLLFLILGMTAIGTLFIHKVRQKILDFGLKMHNFYLLSAAFLLFLLVLTNSVYFHENFGVNITAKEFRFGMIVAFVGVGLLFMGALLERRRRVSSLDFGEFSPGVREQYPQRSHQELLPSDELSATPSREVKTVGEALAQSEEQGKIELS